MKPVLVRIALLTALCTLAFASGCIYDASTGQVVITEKICVSFDEYRESNTLGSAVVCDRFKQRILERIAAYGATLDDIESISMMSGTYHVTKPASKKYNHEL